MDLRRSAIRDSENEKNEEKDETLGACTYVDHSRVLSVSVWIDVCGRVPCASTGMC